MADSSSPRGWRFWIRRYLPAELVGTAGALLGAALTYQVSGSLVLAAAGGTVAENLGFYGVMLTRTYREQLRHGGLSGGQLTSRAALRELGRSARQSSGRRSWPTPCWSGPLPSTRRPW